jgi:hypothetical protein
LKELGVIGFNIAALGETRAILSNVPHDIDFMLPIIVDGKLRRIAILWVKSAMYFLV